jgi:uncharacterized protein (DUF2384 family)
MKQGNRPDESLSPEETDHVARVFALAEQVFGSRDRALNWLRSKDRRVNGRTPLGILHTESGRCLVENMLSQIDEGIYT